MRTESATGEERVLEEGGWGEGGQEGLVGPEKPVAHHEIVAAQPSPSRVPVSSESVGSAWTASEECYRYSTSGPGAPC